MWEVKDVWIIGYGAFGRKEGTESEQLGSKGKPEGQG